MSGTISTGSRPGSWASSFAGSWVDGFSSAPSLPDSYTWSFDSDAEDWQDVSDSAPATWSGGAITAFQSKQGARSPDARTLTSIEGGDAVTITATLSANTHLYVNSSGSGWVIQNGGSAVASGQNINVTLPADWTGHIRYHRSNGDRTVLAVTIAPQ